MSTTVHHTAPIQDAMLPHVQLLDLFKAELSDQYNGEKHLLVWLESVQPIMQHEELTGLFGDYTIQSRKQLIRMEEIFGTMLFIPGKGKSDTTKGLILEMKKAVSKLPPKSPVRDAAVIFSMGKLIAHKIACYTNMEMLATGLGMEEASNLFHISVEEEKDILLLFSDLGERRIKNLVQTTRY